MARLDGKIERAGYRNGFDGSMFGLDENDRTIEHGPRGTHPRAQHGAMGGRLMMRMMPGVLDGLRLRKPADGQDAQDKED